MSLTEAEVCMRYITPSVENAGWDLKKQVLREYSFTSGMIVVTGKRIRKGVPKRADYILEYKSNFPLAVIEAKSDKYSIGAGMQQGLEYAETLDIPFVYSSNGKGFIEHDRTTGFERELTLEEFPSPEVLWNRYIKAKGFDEIQEKVFSHEYHFDIGSYTPRYYQRIAISRAVEAVVNDRDRILLVMATGTGKTYTAFQIIHRLWKSETKKRILFLADRNILVDQTITGDFSPFGDKMTKINRNNISFAHEIYLALYQSMTGSEDWQQTFKQYSEDFFDLIIVDECHRGSAKDNSAWRAVLDYFKSATHIGMTATPKEDNDISTQGYFGEPVYTYSLKQGISDGFLAPYKVVRMGIDKDLMGFRPMTGQKDKYGNIIDDKVYDVDNFDRDLVLEKRHELVAKEVSRYMREDLKDRFAKTIIFCQDIEHAENMRRAIVNENNDLVKVNYKYVMRITGDNPEGKLQLDNFIEPSETYPVIATTSKLLTTGVDAKTVKIIVLDMNISSMTEFKQIIGRGTRLRPDYNKYYFTILDFRGVTKKFADPDFDGDPIPLEKDELLSDIVKENPNDGNKDDIKERKINRFYLNKEEVTVIDKTIQYLDPSGKLVEEPYQVFFKRAFLEQYKTQSDFEKAWISTKLDNLLAIFEEESLYVDELADFFENDQYDLFDLILKTVYDKEPIAKSERIKNVLNSDYYNSLTLENKKILDTILDIYQFSNQLDFQDINILKLDKIKQLGMPGRIISSIGGRDEYEKFTIKIKKLIYIGGRKDDNK